MRHFKFNPVLKIDATFHGCHLSAEVCIKLRSTHYSEIRTIQVLISDVVTFKTFIFHLMVSDNQGLHRKDKGMRQLDI